MREKKNNDKTVVEYGVQLVSSQSWIPIQNHLDVPPDK